MDIKDYKFNIGDEVITIDGIKGKITSICDCVSCRWRGFYEPFWMADGEDCERCIDIYEANAGFSNYYKIGKYRFNDFDKDFVLKEMSYYEDELKKLRGQLKLIEETKEPVDEAIEHFKWSVSHDMFSEPVVTYAKLAIEALKKYKEN